jgi:hypothetical protein
MLKVYQVLKKFDSQKGYGFEIRPQYTKYLAVMKKGEKIDSKIFANKYKNEFTSRRNTLEATLAVVYKTISIGKKIDILKEIPNELIPILHVDFCKLETVFYFRSQLRGSNRKNIKSVTDGTKDTYTRHLHYFNNWIFGKTLEYKKQILF